MQVNKRTYYDPKFKIEVLDFMKVESVTAAARQYGLEPSLLYSWKSKEEDIRASFGPASRTKPVTTATGTVATGSAKQQSLRLVEAPPAPLSAAPKVKRAHPDGPKLVTRGLGEWLRKVVREELEVELPKAVEEKLAKVVDDLVEKKLEAMFAGRKRQSDG